MPEFLLHISFEGPARTFLFGERANLKEKLLDIVNGHKHCYLYIIGRFCLTRKMITLPNGLKSSTLVVFQGGFMVFHGFWLVSIVFQGSFMVFGWFP